jgi:hypothetical protein
MPCSVWITSSNYRGGEPVDLTSRSRQQIDANTTWNFRSARSPDTADIILFIESAQHKFQDYGAFLRSNELIQKFPNRCFAFDFADNPAGFLPGVYPSLPMHKHDRRRFRAGGYMGINPFASQSVMVEPQLLLSFRGFASGSARKELFKLDLQRSDCRITQTFKWCNHTDAEKQLYAEELRSSKFVLCPRGIGTASIRLFETMASGRVPLILADDWVPPTGPSWNECSIILAENRVEEVADIADQFEPQWREMGKAAREAYENWFSPEVNIFRILQACEEIILFRPAGHDEREFQEHWSDWQFKWKNGWTFPQRAARAVIQGNLSEKLANRLTRIKAKSA